MIFSVFTYSAIAQIGINPIENKFPYQPKTNEKGIEFNPRVYQKVMKNRMATFVYLSWQSYS